MLTQYQKDKERNYLEKNDCKEKQAAAFLIAKYHGIKAC